MSFFLMLRLHSDQWRPSLNRIRKGVWLAIHPWICIRVAKAFLPTGTQPIVRVDPRVMFKYAGNYVSLDLSLQEGASILIDHYGFLKERVKTNFFPAIIHGRLVVIGESGQRWVRSILGVMSSAAGIIRSSTRWSVGEQRPRYGGRILARDDIRGKPLSMPEKRDEFVLRFRETDP